MPLETLSLHPELYTEYWFLCLESSVCYLFLILVIFVIVQFHVIFLIYFPNFIVGLLVGLILENNTWPLFSSGSGLCLEFELRLIYRFLNG